MGRFYETSKSDFVSDKMFELPVDMMYKAIQTKDKAVDDSMASATVELANLVADVHSSDKAEANRIITEKKAAIDDIIQNIQNDPSNYQKQAGNTRKLSRDISDIFTSPTGQIKLMSDNNKSIISNLKSIQEKHKDEPTYAKAVQDEYLKSYSQGLQYDSTSRTGMSPNKRETYELKHSVDDFIKMKMEANSWSKEQETPGGAYIYKNRETGEALTPQRIAQAYSDYFKSNQGIQDAVGDRTRLGVEGFENANLDQAIKYNSKGQMIGTSDGYYGKNIRAAMSQMAYNKASTSNTLSDNADHARRIGYQREDAKNIPEELPSSTYEAVYNVNTNSAESLTKVLDDTNKRLQSNYEALAGAAGITPETNPTLYAQLVGTDKTKGGNKTAIQTALAMAPPGTADQLKQDYQFLRTQKNLLNSQVQGFTEHVRKTNKNIKIGQPGWLKSKEVKTLYDNYVLANAKLDGQSAPLNRVTFNGIKFNTKEIEGYKNFIVQAMDDVKFNVDNTKNGQFLEFETVEGDKTIYVPRGHKQMNKATGKMQVVTETGMTVSVGEDGKKKQTTTYITAPDGMLSIRTLVAKGLSTKLADGSYVTRLNGKDVGLIVDEQTLGVDQSLDDTRKSNYGVNMQIANNRVTALIPTSSMPSKKVDQYLSDNYENMTFNYFANKTNFNTLGRKEAQGPEGGKYITMYGKAGVLTKSGGLHWAKSDEEIRKIRQIVYSESH